MLTTRVLTVDDWPLWRELRRAALAQAPYAFGSTLAQWSGAGDTEARWRARLEAAAYNVVIELDGNPAAMVSGTDPTPVPEGSDSLAVELISMWVAPAARGRGAGDAAVRAVLDWAARTHPQVPVVLAVKADNAAAIALYRRHNFAHLGLSPDDPTEILMRHG